MQVGVEEAVPEQHADDRGGPQVDQPVALLRGERQGLRRVGLEAGQELHAQHGLAAVLPVDEREVDAREIVEVGGEGLGVVGLAPQVDLAPRVLDELGDHAPGLVARQHPLEQEAEHLEQPRVARKRHADAGLDDLDDPRVALARGGAVDLRVDP